MTLRLSTFALLCLSASPLAAQTATPSGAAALEATLRAYLGPVDGVVSVTAGGSTYGVTIDPAPYLAMVPPEAGLSARISPLTFTVADLGGGRWQVDSDQGFDISLSVPGVLELAVSSKSSQSSGVFNEALAAFESSNGRTTGLSVQETISGPGQPPFSVSYSIESMEYKTGATAAAGGGVDVQSRMQMTGLVEKISIPPSSDMPIPIDVDMTAAGYVVDTRSSGVRTKAMLDLWAWAVAHPAPELIMGDIDGLRGAIRAALPLWDDIGFAGTLDDLTIGSMFGNGSAQRMDVAMDLTGAVPEGRLRYMFGVSGLSLPTEVMPPWAPALLPDNFSVDLSVTGYDLATPANILLDELSPMAPPPEDLEDRLLAALLPTGGVGLSLAPGGIGNAAFALDWQGAMEAGPAVLPAGSAVLGLTGVDALLAALSAAPADVSEGAVPAIMMARGMARAEGDRLVWEIEADAMGTLMINGTDMSAMMGGR
jgi:hypothetical protein